MGDFSTSVGAAVPRLQKTAAWRYSTATGGIVNTTAAVVRTGVSGQRMGVLSLDYINTSATASEFEIYSGANVIYRGYAPANMTAPASIPGLANDPLFTNAGEDLSIKMVTTATATRFNLRGKFYDA